MESGMYGISSLDPRIAATEKFIREKNIPPNQVEHFLLSMGADPKLASLVFKYRKVTEAAKNAQQGPPPTASVNQKITDQYRQMQQGIASMPAPAIANAPMQGGITGQPMPQMAGGGIIAFAKGSPGVLRRNPIKTAVGTGIVGAGVYNAMQDDQPPPTSGMDVEEIPEDLSDEDIKLLAGIDTNQQSNFAAPANLPAPPVFKRPDFSQLNTAIFEAEKRLPESRDKAYELESKREENIGETKAIEARAKLLSEQKEKAITSPEKKFWTAFAQAGFAASAKGARNLWETLSIGGVEGMKAYDTMKEKERDTLEKIADKQLQLDSMTSAVRRGVMDRADKRFDAARSELLTLRLQLEAQKNALNTAENTNAAANWRTIYSNESADRRAATAMAGKVSKTRLTEQYYADIAQAQRTTEPKIKQALLNRAKNTLNAIGKLEQQESGYQSTIERLRQQNEMLNGSGNDGFSDLSGD